MVTKKKHATRTIRAWLPTFHPAQIEIAQREARFKVIAAGRRFGKGVLGVAAAFKAASRGKHCRWIAPSYVSDSYQSGWRMAAALAAQIPTLEVLLQKRAFDFARLGGGWLQFRTAEEPDALRGEGIDFVVFDEAAHVEGLEEMWEQCVRPSLMDTRGDAWFISTPFGFNYFNDLFTRGFHESDWSNFQFPTSANPHIDPAEIAHLRASLPALVARQEVDAEFVQLAGALFKRQNIEVLEDEPLGVDWIRSWDLAFTEKTTADYTAGVKMGMTADGTIVIADVVVGHMEWPDAIRAIANTAKLDGPRVRQGIEAVGAQVGVVQNLMRDPFLARYSFEPILVTRDKLTRALPVVARSEQGKFAVVRRGWTQNFIDELCAFPEGRHDDQVDAVSGGMTLLSEPTGAISDVTKIFYGTPVKSGSRMPAFTRKRLETSPNRIGPLPLTEGILIR
jgi:predicted phage terminase large subunit-like protein